MATAAHCLFCFETLAAHLEKRESLGLDEVQRLHAAYIAAGLGAGLGESAGAADDTPPPTETPLFVTWNLYDAAEVTDPDADHELRGCIGTFAAQPLASGLADYALTSALEDHRFRPIARRELPRLGVAVTLLTDFEPATGGAFDWELGKHGLRLSFRQGGRRYSATYLPDVAPEQGWTQEQTIVSLMRKAGWSGRGDQWRTLEPSLEVVRYQGKKRSLTYGAYKAWRDWVDTQK